MPKRQSFNSKWNKRDKTNLSPEVDEISITLINSFRMWPQGVILQESVVIICGVCTHILEEVFLAKSNITILHDMGTVGRIFIGSPPFYLHKHHNEIIWLCRQIRCHVCSFLSIYSKVQNKKNGLQTFTSSYCWCRVSVRKLCISLFTISDY